MEKSRVTEIKVRIDCNGCVHKIKKALHGIEGIEDVHVDLQQQKITITGSADPGNLVRAIRKTRKTAVICLHEEQPPQQKDTPSEGGAPPANPPEESPQKDAPPTTESSPPVQRNPTSQPKVPSSESAGATSASKLPSGVEQIHEIYHHPSSRNGFYSEIQQGRGAKWDKHHEFREPRPRPPPPPIYVTHGYVTEFMASGDILRPPTNQTEYANRGQFHPVCGTSCNRTYMSPPSVTENTNQFRPPPPASSQPVYAIHGNQFRPPPPLTKYASPSLDHPPYSARGNIYRPQPDAYTGSSQSNKFRPPPFTTESEHLQSPPRYFGLDKDEDYYGSNGNISSVFSEDNPNSCQIV